jgi:haloalkane dehalogenase
MQTSEWIDRDLFPFESRYLTLADGHRLHYVDEGSGPVVLFSHGTPEWCFGWRDLIAALRPRFRCLAPDLLGMGLSDKPQDADYGTAAHAARLRQFIEALGLRDLRIIGNDFGLSIALAYALDRPENVAKISLFNGWMWRLDQDPHYSAPVGMFSGWLGRVLYRHFNFPVNVIMPSAFGNRRKNLPPAVHRHYRQALPNYAARVAAYAFVHNVLHDGDWWDGLWQQRQRLAQHPMLIFWGMKDRFVPPYELQKWREAFPEAHVVECPEAGHFVQEEESALMAQALEAFFAVPARS